MTTIKIKNLRVKTVIGAFGFERDIKQELIVNLKVKFDDSKAAFTDNLADTLDYKNLKRSVINTIQSSSFHLLEALSEKILDTVMENPIVAKVEIEIDKPGALKFVDSVSLSKKRKR